MAPFAAREKMDKGLSLLHLCVKYGQFEALNILVLQMNQLLNWKDDDGDTILHMAVRDKRTEIIQYLVENTIIDVNAKNSKGQTPMSILDQTPPDTTTSKIRKILTPKLCNSDINTQTQPVRWLNEKRDAIMVVAVLIATMAFQAGMSPAGGVWQEDSDAHRAGEAVMARNHPKAYESFARFNVIAFLSSLTSILLLISGLPLIRRRLFMWILVPIMWLTVTSIAVTYAISIVMVTPEKQRRYSSSHVIEIHGLAIWFWEHDSAYRQVVEEQRINCMVA
ncbi:hypothetical protein CDL12_07428 [Handroanthus impetiginosus]|uniref:PGG domain-containing protein n=1 Tax=Handroanthus impetiginosus TaxID=429701 RepID=A0A2G9HQS5_9LAMI|nr:hypothetical protein CDL12_07428 [Handroanthus impetiginosus]